QKINTKSKYLFVDLVNDKDSVIKIIILDAVNKQLNSSIFIPGSISTGYYWLRAYTREMAEHDTNNICVKPLYIVNRSNENNYIKPIRKPVSKDTMPVVDFFPEGGSIITGINSTVALHVSHMHGVPVITEGFIKDDHDAIVSRFVTNGSGYSKFNFEPSGYRKYRAVIDWHGKELNYPLPPFNFYKGQISVTRQTAGYKLRILLGDSIYRKDFVSYLVGVSKDSLIFASIGSGLYETVATDQQFPDGITTFYLFDEKFNLLSERSIYVHGKSVVVKVETDKHVYGKREKVTLNLSVTDAQQRPIPSLISISVSDTTLGNRNEDCDVPANSFGRQSVDGIFLSKNECIDENSIDLIMMARNKSYETLGKLNVKPAIIDADSLLYIKGKVINSKNEPASGKVINLLVSSGDLSFHSDTTDIAGRFSIPFENYQDSMQFALEIKDLNGRTQNDKIIIDDPAYPKLKTPAFLKEYLQLQPKTIRKYINAYYEFGMDDDKHALPAVVVNKSQTNMDYDQSKRISPASKILTSRELNERNGVGNSVLNVGGMHLLHGFLVINGLTSLKAPDPSSEPLLLVNGAEVALSGGVGESSPVMTYLNGLNPKNIDFIEILKGGDGANYGLRGGNGVILVNLSNKTKDGTQSSNNLRTYYAKGISNPGLFHDMEHQGGGDKALSGDNRSTLFWNGSFITDNKASLTFYTSDIPATYQAKVTGITIHGDIIYKTIKFENK
ncbi:MAG: TonB-dependent receptor plug domain-containing protein, partial [Ginsengibacter sp.]